ncbi:hypothetical protein OIU84_029396 [Salix udensis]|uniref:NAC domain-containing protein n=1 Tax=Salix udensis TaxID=889485 RepID=A0AAD6P7X1_9ROSI|nr:hypothetical protein OIU84_029396 [Salix udensis]
MGRNSSLPPGFRFHPTDVELVKYYLKRKVLGKKLHFQAIAEIEINKYAPWDLPNKSCLRTGDLKWYFFCPTEKKYASGVRMKRATDIGYWKTTGKDRPVQLEEKELAGKGIAQDGYVLCVVFKKDGPGPKNGAQYGAPFNEDEWDDDEVEEEMTVQLAILPAVMHAHAVMLPTNPNMSIATSSHVSECTCAGPPISCPSQTPSTACTTLPRVSNDVVASTESLQVVHGGVNGEEADSSAGMSAPALQQPWEAPQIVDDYDDIFSSLDLLDNVYTERADFGGITEAETDKHWSLGGLVPLEGSADSIPISQYFMDPTLPGSSADFLELMDLDTPLYQSREE